VWGVYSEAKAGAKKENVDVVKVTDTGEEDEMATVYTIMTVLNPSNS